MKFDKSKILTVVTADQAKVGQKGWFSILPQYIQKNMSDGQEPSVLSNIDLDSQSPFTKEGENRWSLFYPAPEPTYAERQAEWVKENNVRFGTKVRFTKNFTYCEDGSGCCEHKCVKGMEGVVKCTKDDCLTVLVPYFGGWWNVPFTALEVIKEPTYRPYNNDELNDLVGEVLTSKKSGRKKLVTGKPTASDFVTLDGCYITAEGLLSNYYRNTNETCGIKE